MSGLTLYELDAKFKDVMALAEGQAEANEGEIPEDMAVQLDTLEMNIVEKRVNICRLIKNQDAESIAVFAEADRLYRRGKRLTNSNEWLKSYVAARAPGWKYRDQTCIVSWRGSKAVEITDEAAIPALYKHVVTETKIDRIAIKDSISKGVDVPGAKVIERQSIQIK